MLSGLQQNLLYGRLIMVPIIFITGHGDIPMSVQALKKGASDFLTKPFNDQELLDAIHQAIEKDKQAKQRQAKLKFNRQ
jgi:FixJ family two-component response regulator